MKQILEITPFPFSFIGKFGLEGLEIIFIAYKNLFLGEDDYSCNFWFENLIF